MTENQLIDLPVGAVHALENPCKIPLELIEVQVGSYLGKENRGQIPIFLPTKTPSGGFAFGAIDFP